MPTDTLLLLAIVVAVFFVFVMLLFFFHRLFRQLISWRREPTDIPNLPRRQQADIPNLLGGERYKVGYELGRGMNAAAFLVEDRNNPNMPLVAKVLLTSQDDPRITMESFRRHLARFQREMRHLQQVGHSEYIVPIHDIYPNALPPVLCYEAM
jgi:hypothetical protein